MPARRPIRPPPPISPRGGRCCDALGPFDIGQAVVVIDGHVVAVEDIEGTDGLLARVARLREEGRIRAKTGRGVLVKAPKSGQDLRFDLPTVGPRTIEGVAKAGLAGIAIIAGNTIAAELASHDRGRRQSRPVHPGAVGVTPARATAERAKDISDRDGGIRRSPRRQFDEGAASAPWRRGPVRGRRRPRDGARRPDVAVSDRRALDHRARGRRQAIAEDPAADQARPRPR